jgi:putative intracellular protease/amidase
MIYATNTVVHFAGTATLVSVYYIVGIIVGICTIVALVAAARRWADRHIVVHLRTLAGVPGAKDGEWLVEPLADRIAANIHEESVARQDSDEKIAKTLSDYREVTDDKLNLILYQMTPNGGSSVYDKIDQLWQARERVAG